MPIKTHTDSTPSIIYYFWIVVVCYLALFVYYNIPRSEIVYFVTALVSYNSFGSRTKAPFLECLVLFILA
jgi:hypothetical protein